MPARLIDRKFSNSIEWMGLRRRSVFGLVLSGARTFWGSTQSWSCAAGCELLLLLFLQNAALRAWAVYTVEASREEINVSHTHLSLQILCLRSLLWRSISFTKLALVALELSRLLVATVRCPVIIENKSTQSMHYTRQYCLNANLPLRCHPR